MVGLTPAVMLAIKVGAPLKIPSPPCHTDRLLVALFFHQISFCFTAFDSSIKALSKVFWVRIDPAQRSEADGRKRQKRHEMALTVPVTGGSTLYPKGMHPKGEL